MKRAIIIITAIVFVVSMMGTVFAADVNINMLNWTANTVLAKYGMDKTIVKAVKEQNKKGMTLKDIQMTDSVWRGILEGTIAIQDNMMVSDCAKAAKAIVDSHDYLFEAFITDDQGANVCMTDKTGDYWQGDEAKFVKAFNGGIGAVLVSEVEKDGDMNVSQVSVPVMSKGRAIGTITFGVNADKVK
ncbi:hypothetical protein MUP29_11915 [bacterium]|nr:hypothetical protein [bacterium]